MYVRAFPFLGREVKMISILFGAGASYGSEKPGIEVPPLGNNLFHELDRLGGCFNKLSEELKSNFSAHGFETAMLEIPNDSSILNPLQNELALYLSEFAPSMNSAYVRLFSKIYDINKPQLITLNYDLLIEQSLNLCRQKISNKTNFRPSLLKLHGSSNFIPDLGDLTFVGLKTVDCSVFIETDGVKVIEQHELQQWIEKHNAILSPVMCMYSKDKKMVVCPFYFNKAKRDFIKVINRTKLMVIIGTKYTPHDKHIWDVILSNRRSRILLVDPYPDNNLKKIINIRNKKIKKNEIIEKTFYDSVDDIAKIINDEIKKHKKT
ncbi:TPA: hypothetical protein MCW73_000852 [Klebsiella pneumoniae]|uniref:hypothetical protein n=1 Tax=Klebsiella pneumoniae TaxID=573 RepID=UPI001071C225|nr:hypothetical protein [Klebsiella pneumoniae]MBZ1870315.1 hypothetical protein [Klebsiella pneumoniae]HBT7660990.1 hypothetical protein [Klebsiella pneumoniae]HBT7869550.1 hypothetical protein [Klebsiella pneumoniae]HBU1981926.1 hypothetical protein [Klebsiella pneumoniae]HBU2044752.1 hypothetical protein [Klebsiella pneumoniae]